MSYVPDAAGRYTITIKYGGDEIPYSPYRIHALPTGDASKCLVTGQSLLTVALIKLFCLNGSFLGALLFLHSVNWRTWTR